jgi:hypothetical protein
MTQSRALARIAAFFKLSARGGTPFVNAAGGFLTHFATQRSAAWGRVVGAAHAAQGGCEVLAQARGHRAAACVHFFHAEVHSKTGAAGAATGASRHVY